MYPPGAPACALKDDFGPAASACAAAMAMPKTLVTAGFGVSTVGSPETETAGEKGNNVALGVRGSKSGLPEGANFITLFAKTIGGGTSTIYGTTPATSLEIQLWQ